LTVSDSRSEEGSFLAVQSTTDNRKSEIGKTRRARGGVALGDAYRVLAAVYDAWQATYGKSYAERITPRTLDSLRRYRPDWRSLCDLGCGTGSLLLNLAGSGRRLIGVDASAEMLREARRKARAAGQRISWIHADIRDFRVPAPVDAVGCFYDTLNHLGSIEDLRQTFAAVHAALRPGGTFMFDVNTLHCFRTLWDHLSVTEGPGLTMILDNEYDHRSRTGLARVTIFRRRGHLYTREFALVVERYFPEREVMAALRAAGLRPIARQGFDPFGDSARPIKTWWVARRF
jgi:SAM-dependent methyltransferase